MKNSSSLPGTAFLFVLALFFQLLPVPLAEAATNRVPTADAQSVVTNEDTALSITLTGSDPEGAALSYSVSAGPYKGSLTCSGAQCTYKPVDNVSGSDFFNFKVSDGSLTSRSARVSITISAVNDAPTATSASYTMNEDSGWNIILQGNDIEKDTLNYSLVTQPSMGTFTFTSGNAGTYTPYSNLYGQDSFTFVANDGKANSAPATITLTINAVNDVPTASDQSVSTNENTPVTVPLAVNDVDGDLLSVVFGYSSGHGTVESVGTEAGLATVIYTPEADYNGADSFTYRVTDGSAYSGTATVSVNIEAVNDVPVVTDVSFEVKAGGTIVGTLYGTDAEGSTLTFSVADGASHGVVTMTANDRFTYKADQNYSGVDSFTFVASDGEDLSALGTVTLKVLPEDYFTPIRLSALALWNATVTSDSEKTVVDLGSDGCYRFQASPLILPGIDEAGASIEYAVGTLFNPCMNYNPSENYMFLVRTDTGAVYRLTSELNLDMDPNSFSFGTFDGNTLVTPLTSSNVDSEDPDNFTGGLLITQFHEDGTTETYYADPFEGVGTFGSIVSVDDMLALQTWNNPKPNCQNGAKIYAWFCGIRSFFNTQSLTLDAIAYTEDNGLEADFTGESRLVVKNSSGDTLVDKIVWGQGIGGNNSDESLNTGYGCHQGMVNWKEWLSAVASKTFPSFSFSQNVKWYDPGDAGCTTASGTEDNTEADQSAIQGVVLGFNPGTQKAVVWSKAAMPDVSGSEYTRISQLDENGDFVCDALIYSGQGRNPFHGTGTSISVDRLGRAYTNADYLEDGIWTTGVVVIDLNCSIEYVMGRSSVVAGGSFSGVSLAEDASGNTIIMTALGSSNSSTNNLYLYNMTTGEESSTALGGSSAVSAAPVLDSQGRIIIVDESNVMSIYNASSLSYGQNIWPRPGHDNWGSSTAEFVR